MNYLKFVLFLLFVSLSNSFSTNKINYLEPRPGAILVSTNNNIIIGFETNVGLTIPDILKSIIVTGSISMKHDGSVIICDDGKKIIFNPESPFTPGEKVNVRLTGKLSRMLNVNSKEYSFTIATQKVSWDPSKSFDDEIKDGQKNYQTNDMPLAFPGLNIIVNNNPSNGDIFLSNWAFGSFQPYLIITDKNGVPYWYQQRNADCDDFKMQPNGNLTFFAEATSMHYEIDVNYNTIHTFHCGNGYTTDLHELRVLNSGYAYVMAYDPEIVNMQDSISGGNPNATVVGLIIQEVDVNNNVVFQWRSWDHFSILDAWHQNLLASYIDAVHGNAIEIDNDSNVIISSRHLDEITKINRTTGNIIWRFGGKHNQFTFLGDTLKFTYQHAIRRIANGDLTLYDNGNYHSPPFSRAVEYSMDTLNKTVTSVWEFRHTPSIFGSAMGYVQRLSNGNTFICWGLTNPTVTEVTPGGTVEFEMSLPTGDDTYRAYKNDWNGGPVEIENDHNVIPLTFKLNQNYPNPFNPTTKITYQVASNINVKISIYDILGREVQILVNEKQQPGTYMVEWNASNYPSGVYFYKMQTETFSDTKKLILVK